MQSRSPIRSPMQSKASGLNAGAVATAALAAFIGGVACASTGEGSLSTRGSGDITRAELAATSVDDAMEAIALLRPQWLRARPTRTPNNPIPVVGVVIDNMARATREDLAQLPIGQVERISFMNAADATIRFGPGYGGGAIIVTTRR